MLKTGIKTRIETGMDRGAQARGEDGGTDRERDNTKTACLCSCLHLLSPSLPLFLSLCLCNSIPCACAPVPIPASIIVSASILSLFSLSLSPSLSTFIYLYPCLHPCLDLLCLYLSLYHCLKPHLFSWLYPCVYSLPLLPSLLIYAPTPVSLSLSPIRVSNASKAPLGGDTKTGCGAMDTALCRLRAMDRVPAEETTGERRRHDAQTRKPSGSPHMHVSFHWYGPLGTMGMLSGDGD